MHHLFTCEDSYLREIDFQELEIFLGFLSNKNRYYNITISVSTTIKKWPDEPSSEWKKSVEALLSHTII